MDKNCLFDLDLRGGIQVCPKQAVVVDRAVLSGDGVAEYVSGVVLHINIVKYHRCIWGWWQGTVAVPMVNLCSIWDVISWLIAF